MENCYLFYLIRNLLKQSHCTVFGLVFLGTVLLKTAATFFYGFHLF